MLVPVKLRPMWKNETLPINFDDRRKIVFNKLKNGVAIFPSGQDTVRNNNVHHPFRQDSNFYYLTGFDEPNSVCLLAPQNKHPFQLFVPPRDKAKEVWEGKTLGVEGAKAKTNADAVLSSSP